jgi:Hydrazine synthase alpha subunit middle domain
LRILKSIRFLLLKNRKNSPLMKNHRTTIILTFIMATGIGSLFLASCGEKSKEAGIILTRTGVKIGDSKFSAADSRKNTLRSEIVAIEPGDLSPKPLTASFYSARSPEISNDGRFMIFAGQKKQGDKWQIWETDLANLKTRQLTKLKTDCTDPAYLPLGRFLFTSHSTADSLKPNESIFTSNIDGSDLTRITYNPDMYAASSVLRDGRILTIGVQEFPETGDQKFMVMRPDGTKSELFYKSSNGSELSGRGLETDNGRIVFIESVKSNPGKGNLISVSYNNPMHSRLSLSSGIEGDFMAVCPEPSGKLLVSYRKKASERYALYEFDPENKSLGKPVYSNNDFDVLEVVEAVKHNRSRKLPSEVNAVIKTGLIMCQDVNVNDDPVKIPDKKISKVEIMGIDSSMGIFKPSKDGSFYLKVIADKPFQIRTLDEMGNTVRKCDWIWLRPNERRGCVGCHEDQDIVPDNRIPLAVKKAPVGIPVHINKMKEKMIDTE